MPERASSKDSGQSPFSHYPFRFEMNRTEYGLIYILNGFRLHTFRGESQFGVDIFEGRSEIRIVITDNQVFQGFAGKLVLVIHDCWINGVVQRQIRYAAIEVHATILKNRGRYAIWRYFYKQCVTCG